VVLDAQRLRDRGNEYHGLPLIVIRPIQGVNTKRHPA